MDSDSEVSDSSASSSASGSPKAVQPRILPTRSTRGLRLNDLHGEGDDEFWAQDFFADRDQEDGDYEFEQPERDTVDSDFFDEEEDDEDEGITDSDEEEGRSKRKSTYVDPLKKRVDGASEQSKAKPRAPKAQTVVTPRTPSSRSTRHIVSASSSSAPRPSPRPRPQFRELTQEERLAEAQNTEIENVKSLQELLRMEEEKKKVTVRKVNIHGPTVIFRSSLKDTPRNKVIFTGVTHWPKALRVRTLPQITMPCFLTGKKALYRDPVTGLPYADVESFKEIRRRYESGEISKDGPKYKKRANGETKEEGRVGAKGRGKGRVNGSEDQKDDKRETKSSRKVSKSDESIDSNDSKDKESSRKRKLPSTSSPSAAASPSSSSVTSPTSLPPPTSSPTFDAKRVRRGGANKK